MMMPSSLIIHMSDRHGSCFLREPLSCEADPIAKNRTQAVAMASLMLLSGCYSVSLRHRIPYRCAVLEMLLRGRP